MNDYTFLIIVFYLFVGIFIILSIYSLIQINKFQK